MGAVKILLTVSIKKSSGLLQTSVKKIIQKSVFRYLRQKIVVSQYRSSMMPMVSQDRFHCIGLQFQN